MDKHFIVRSRWSLISPSNVYQITFNRNQGRVNRLQTLLEIVCISNGCQWSIQTNTRSRGQSLHVQRISVISHHHTPLDTPYLRSQGTLAMWVRREDLASSRSSFRPAALMLVKSICHPWIKQLHGLKQQQSQQSHWNQKSIGVFGRTRHHIHSILHVSLHVVCVCVCVSMLVICFTWWASSEGIKLGFTMN